MTTPRCACTEPERSHRMHGEQLLRPLMPHLVPWLVGQRWFSHERGCFRQLSPLGVTVLARPEANRGGDPVLVHAVAEAEYGGGARHRYQILVGLRPQLPPAFPEAPFGRASGGPWDGWFLYEATGDPQLMALMLDEALAGRSGGALRLNLTPGSRIAGGLTPRRLGVEQSNTAIVFGEELLLKILRQPQPGVHPEIEVLAALTGVGSTRTPRLAGWFSDGEEPGPGRRRRDAGSVGSVLGIVEEFFDAQGDGWRLAVDNIARLLADETAVGALSGFTDQARALGAAVAAVHVSLAEAYPAAPLDAEAVRVLLAEMETRLADAVALVPELEADAPAITQVYHDFARQAAAGGLLGQRTHGDLHLGQVLRTADGWRVIDFEGEPSRPIEERGTPQSALRDVAGMLRSFDYAAQHALHELLAARPDADADEILRHRRCARAWMISNCHSFVHGYASAGPLDPRLHPRAMRAYKLDKAVYEARYEAEHRPDRLPVPMAAVRRLLAPGQPPATA